MKKYPDWLCCDLKKYAIFATAFLDAQFMWKNIVKEDLRDLRDYHTAQKMKFNLRDYHTAQKMKFPIKNFFSKQDQIRRKLRIWSHLLKKSLTEKFTFCAVSIKFG